MNYCVVFTAYADKDLDGILDYIAQDSPIRAIEFLDSLQDRIKKTLGTFPNGGTRTGECRYITFDNYIVVYEVNEELSEVYVYLISEGHRQWRVVLDERV